MNCKPLSWLAPWALASLLAGCAAVSKVETGQVAVRERMLVQVASPWNRFERGQSDDTPIWTQEGITVDALQFYVGVKDGQLIAPTPREGKLAPLAFKSSMQAADIVALFQSLQTRDGSTFQLDKLEPVDFVGTRGFRYEFSVVRKLDDVRLRGVAYGAVQRGELYLISYTAPRLAFFNKYAAQVEAIARSASIKG